MIVEAIRIGRLNLEALHAKLREEVQAELRKLGKPLTLSSVRRTMSLAPSGFGRRPRS